MTFRHVNFTIDACLSVCHYTSRAAVARGSGERKVAGAMQNATSYVPSEFSSWNKQRVLVSVLQGFMKENQSEIKKVER